MKCYQIRYFNINLQYRKEKLPKKKKKKDLEMLHCLNLWS